MAGVEIDRPSSRAAVFHVPDEETDNPVWECDRCGESGGFCGYNNINVEDALTRDWCA